MIVVKLWGGLGNQFFQYAYAYHLSKKIGTELVLDTSWFKTQNLRRPEILNFNLYYDEVKDVWDENASIAFWNMKNPNRILRIPQFAKYHIGHFNYLKESRYRYSEQVKEYNLDNSYLDGYWQCPAYFNDSMNDLMHLYTPKTISPKVYEIGETLKSTDSVAIHVRRGDYPDKVSPFVRLKRIGEKYYKDALATMEQYNAGKKIEYFLFSNDVTKSKEMIDSFCKININVISDCCNLSALDEWYLMKCCRHQIIGNSSFSWWAAYLNDNPNKIVCAPNNYMGNDDIIPDDWINIDILGDKSHQ